MILVPDPTEKGLWFNPNVSRPARGAHALIIGISRYPFLGGIEGNINWDTGGLGQLVVSASTAAKLFRWISIQGAFGGTSIATCRLLLSPAPEEKSAIDLIANGEYRAANYVDIQASMSAWGDDISNAPSGQEANVALFFFSGHGIEREGKHHLLAQDVLNPRSNSGHQNAIEVDPILSALGGFGIDTGFMLIDACRNDSPEARDLGVQGRSVLVPRMHALSDPKALIGFKATGSGMSAYQRSTDAATIFGQAVLESLEGLPPEFLPYDRQVNPWKLATAPLDKYVKQHVRERLAVILANSNQPVQVWGRPYDEAAVVALRGAPDDAIPAPDIAVSVPGETVSEPAESGSSAISSATPPAPSSPVGANSASIAQRAARAFAHFTKVAPLNALYVDTISDRRSIEQIFIDEELTDYWLNTLKVLNADTGEPMSASMLKVTQAHRSESSESVCVWLDIVVPPKEAQALWIQSGADGDKVCAVIVPADVYQDVPVRLDVTYSKKSRDHAYFRLRSMSARVGEPSERTRDWQVLWDAQREEQIEGLGAALATLDNSQLWRDFKAIQEANLPPATNAAAWTILLRGGHFDRLEGLCASAIREASLPDFAILLIETYRLMHEYRLAPINAGEIESMFNSFVGITQLRLPRYNEVLAMAARQVAFFKSFSLDSAAFQNGANRILRASHYAHCGSFFTALASERGLPHFFTAPETRTSNTVAPPELATVC
jgi:hypothetical protein